MIHLLPINLQWGSSIVFLMKCSPPLASLAHHRSWCKVLGFCSLVTPITIQLWSVWMSFETGRHVTQAGFELQIILPSTPMCWDDMYVTAIFIMHHLCSSMVQTQGLLHVRWMFCQLSCISSPNNSSKMGKKKTWEKEHCLERWISCLYIWMKTLR